MTDHTDDLNLKDRLDLIERMIAEGRRTTESWGWTFLLWGVAYYVAIAWSTWGSGNLAWPVTMLTAGALTGFIAWRRKRNQPPRTVGLAISSVWAAMGISLFLLLMSLGNSGHLTLHSSIAIVSAMLGMANAASSFILRWRLQFACALAWWISAEAACFGSDTQCWAVFLAVIFLCQIVFGLYAMLAEARERRPGALHA